MYQFLAGARTCSAGIPPVRLQMKQVLRLRVRTHELHRCAQRGRLPLGGPLHDEVRGQKRPRPRLAGPGRIRHRTCERHRLLRQGFYRMLLFVFKIIVYHFTRARYRQASI